MPLRSLAPSRLAVTGFVLAGAMAGSLTGASAQYYEPYEDAYPRSYGYRYSEPYDGYYGQRLAPPRVVRRIDARAFGLVRVDRAIRAGSSQVVDGVGVDGSRVRLIFDARSGAFVDRIVLAPAPRQRVARIDPDLADRPTTRLVPRPPERPAALKPPAQAKAPATEQPASPVLPPRAEPEKPAPSQPAEASAPATTMPPATPAPDASPADATQPETGAKRPRVVYPSPIQENRSSESSPPLARADEPVIPVPPVVDLPPVQIQDLAPAKPAAETPAVPVTPME